MLVEMEKLRQANALCGGQLAEREREVRVAEEEVEGLRHLLGQMEEEVGTLRLQLVGMQGEDTG